MRVEIPLLLACLWLAAGAARSQSGGPYVIRKSTVDDGGSRSTGGVYAISGSVGQHDASLLTTSGGTISVTGGFWANGVVAVPSARLFADGFESP
jgi:hypothetical protein